MKQGHSYLDNTGANLSPENSQTAPVLELPSRKCTSVPLHTGARGVTRPDRTNPSRSGRLLSRGAAAWFQHALRRCRKLLQCLRGPDRPTNKLTRTVWTTPFQLCIAAGFAKRTFESADEGRCGLWRQVPVAALAIGPEFKHHQDPSRQQTATPAVRSPSGRLRQSVQAWGCRDPARRARARS
jgi:hypothetical protein